MDYNELLVNQAPPIWAPMRFFITAPLFGIVAGLLILMSDSEVLINRFAVDTIVITHLMTIGFFTFIMLGALTQMLPVISGVKIPKVTTYTTISHILLSLGMVMMAIGLKYRLQELLSISVFYLGIGFLLILTIIVYSMRNIINFTATIKGVLVSLFFAFLIVFLGLLLLNEYATNLFSPYHYVVANIHSVWAIFGFAGILIIAISFHILPMFYVAPRFKNFCKKRVVYLISTGLFLWSLTNIYNEAYALYAKLFIITFFWAFATAVWIKLNKRKRPITDMTIWYWRVASIYLTLGSFLWIFDEFFKHEYIVMVAVLIGVGFILSIMIGMLYKIVPSLVWFHLNAQGYMNIPILDEMINKNLAKIQFILLQIALVGFLFAFYMPIMLIPSALSFIVSMIILEYNILSVVLVYIRTLKSKPDFDMSMFN